MDSTLDPRRLLERHRARRRKRKLRERVMREPLSPRYPFEPEAKLVRAIGLGPGVVFDVGAHRGLYSAVLEDVVSPARLHLFEPLPHLHADLVRDFAGAHVHALALSDHEGTVTIRVPWIDGRRQDSRATLNAHVETLQTGADEIGIATTTIDAFVRQHAIDAIALVKIDVEGHELAVLEGGLETIARLRPLLLVEIESRHHAFPIAAIFAKLAAIGYDGWYLDPAAFAVRSVDSFDAARDQRMADLEARDLMRYLNNFFFVHRSQADTFIAQAEAFLATERRAVA